MREAKLVFRDAVRSYYLDSALSNREVRIVNLEDKNEADRKSFEQLLLTEQKKNFEQSEIMVGLYEMIDNYKEQLKHEKKKNLWLHIKFYSAVVVLGVVTYLTLSD